MNAKERRNSILTLLQNASDSVSATALADCFSVSRQVIVGDVALLRASGYEIFATPRGYLMSFPHGSGGYTGKIVCKHSYKEMKAELYAILDEGCKVLDVSVEHPVYGQLSGQLELLSRHDADLFLKHTKDENATPLSVITRGIHMHTLYCPSEEAFRRVQKKLSEMHILFDDSSAEC